ncbi:MULTISPECIES: protoporphyrinogen oxidase HemJ [Legionella]|uniref:Protoporphyrinogen IX oxidase n=1 Tax=Legionella drozanskii LLAP-1 TaxID=1212489 RepID=A0A0W0TDL1_9GAMM|nr:MULTISPECIES: protoporphyrinogen oxidase HemJ [Legionella]KTC93688.1 transmembrane protein [Legionella drozanskii LLAP-1]PJE12714.1 MAG: protoporphyrinogen oxidase HemJ [Legionella sp.]
MLMIKAFHIIAMVAWFSGLFYLPRLFVYHAETADKISIERFKVMERRLYYGITWPSAILTSLLGILLLNYNLPYYLKAPWLHAKLGLVVLLWIYHLACGHFRKRFAQDKNSKTAGFYRIFNELPTLLLIGIVVLVVVKPF